MAAFLNSPFSKPLIPRYIKKHRVPMEEYPKRKYDSFASFFARERMNDAADSEPDHFVSPCDGWLSVYPIRHDSSFAIKGSHYRLCDLIQDADMTENYRGGLCMVFRLSASDYHHYSFVDDGYIHKNHFIEGKLHSVQPIACSKFPVYRLNRRCWSLLDTKHFGSLVQIEVGALAVGGIINEHEETEFYKNTNMGHFDLCGSTIVLLVEKEKIELLPHVDEFLQKPGKEFRVRQGMWIASAVNPE